MYFLHILLEAQLFLPVFNKNKYDASTTNNINNDDDNDDDDDEIEVREEQR